MNAIVVTIDLFRWTSGGYKIGELHACPKSQHLKQYYFTSEFLEHFKITASVKIRINVYIFQLFILFLFLGQ